MLNRKQELVDEVIRLSADTPSGVCTRDYFRKNSDFTEHVVKKEFGTYSELLRAAGLHEGRLTVAHNNRQSLLESEVRFQEYMTKHVRPWAREHQELEQDQITMIIASDFHGEHVNRFALDVFLDTVHRLQPDHVLFAGDIVNFESVSRWTKNPNRLLNFQTEVDFVVDDILTATRERAPDAQMDYFIGNHEMWLQRLLSEQAPGLASLRCLGFAELFNLSDLDIGLVLGGDMLAPTVSTKKAQVNRAWKLYYDSFVVTHGTSTGRSAAAAELARFKVSGCSGHLHTPATAFSASLDRPDLEWNVLPMMCAPSVAEIYGKGLPMTWSCGFAIVDIFPETRTHFYQPVHVRDRLALSAGVTYRDEST